MKRKERESPKESKKPKLVSPLTQLPVELLVEIFLFLPNLFVLERVCKSWNELLLSEKYKFIWKKNYLYFHDSIVEPKDWRKARRRDLVNLNVWKRNICAHIEIHGPHYSDIKFTYTLAESAPEFVRLFFYDEEEYLIMHSKGLGKYGIFKICKKYPKLVRVFEMDDEWLLFISRGNGFAACLNEPSKVRIINLITGDTIWSFDTNYLTADDFDGTFLLLRLDSKLECLNVKTKSQQCSIQINNLVGVTLLYNMYVPCATSKGIACIDSDYVITVWDIDGKPLRKINCLEKYPIIAYKALLFEDIAIINGYDGILYYQYKSNCIGKIPCLGFLSYVFAGKDVIAYVIQDDELKVVQVPNGTLISIPQIKNSNLKRVLFCDLYKLVLQTSHKIIIYRLNFETKEANINYEEELKNNINNLELFGTKLCYGTVNDTIICKDFQYDNYEVGDIAWAKKSSKSSFMPCTVIERKTVQKYGQNFEQVLLQQIKRDTKPFWVNCTSSNLKTWNERIKFDFDTVSYTFIDPPKRVNHVLREVKKMIAHEQSLNP